jgi:hypothetical protein
MPALAQVSVEVTQEQDQFLPGERIITAVHITNRSGEPLQLGADDDWLTFTVESRERGLVERYGPVPVKGEFVLGSSRVATKRVDLAPYFATSVTGGYTVTATVHIESWGREFTSSAKKFDVIEGAKLWEQEVGLPPRPGSSNSVPETRKYILQSAHFLKSQLRLYLRVTDAKEGRIFRLTAVGPMVSFGQPETQVDMISNLHLLYQDRPHSFSYTMFNPDGQLMLRQTYDYLTSRPRLHPEGDGRVSVVGGTRRIAANDWPPPNLEDLVSEKPATSAPPTEVKQAKP